MTASPTERQYYLELLPNELIWDILGRLSAASLRKLYYAYPSLEMYLPSKGQQSCSHGYLMGESVYPTHEAASRWANKHRQHKLRNNLEKGRMAERDFKNFDNKIVCDIAADGNYVSSLPASRDYILRLDCVRQSPHSFFFGREECSTNRPDHREFDLPCSRLKFSNNARWTVIKCRLDLELAGCLIERQLNFKFSALAAHEGIGHGHNVDSEGYRLQDDSTSEWFWLIDSGHEPAHLFNICVMAKELPSEFSFSADSAYLMILHKDTKVRELYGAGCIVSLQSDPIVSIPLPIEVQRARQPTLDNPVDGSQHFIVLSCDGMYVIDIVSGGSYCIRLPTRMSGSFFCKKDAASCMSVIGIDHAFHIFEHHADMPMSLLRTFQRGDELHESAIIDVDMSSMPHSILFAVEQNDVYAADRRIWLEQGTTSLSSRVIAPSLSIYCAGTDMEKTFEGLQVQQNFTGHMLFITAKKIETHSNDSNARLLAWYKKRSVWRSTEIGTIQLSDRSSLDPDVLRAEGETPHCELSMSVCGSAFAWICNSSICVSEQSSQSTTRSVDIRYSCTGINYPTHFGRPKSVLFTPIDESVLVIFEDPNTQTCRQADKFRDIARDPLDPHNPDRPFRWSRNAEDCHMLVNYNKTNNGWEVRWLTLLVIEAAGPGLVINTSADGSLMIFNQRDHARLFVLDFDC